jgi:hypothetical protein
MSDRYDPRERWRWEEEREREDQGLESEGRFARHGGDPRWGTGGLRVDRRPAPSPSLVAPKGVDVRDARGPYVGCGPRGYHRTDERIYEDVCERMMLSGDLDARDVEVRVSSGEVTLSGTVETRSQKRLAEDIADAVAGVTEVHNRLRLQRAGSPPPSNSSREGAERGRDDGSSIDR